MPDDNAVFDYEAALAACAAGNHAALHRLYDQEGARLLGVAQRLVGDTALAEDIVHDAFINIWTRAGSYDAQRGSARGWLYTVTRHLALNTLRNARHELTIDDDTVAAIDAEASLASWREAGDAFAWQDNAGTVTRCLEQLDPVRRNCLLHAYIDGMSHSQIAQRIDAPLGTVKAWIKRSLVALRECMG